MECIYYVSFVYLDRKGKERFGDTIYSCEVKTESDIKALAEMLRMQYNVNHLRILGFSLLGFSPMKAGEEEC